MNKTNNKDCDKGSISSQLLSLVKDKQEDSKMTVKELVQGFSHSGLGIMLILFSFPMAIPLPYPPGFTTILGLPLFFISIEMILGRKYLWIPERIAKKELSVKHIKIAINAAAKFFAFSERILRPRLEFFSSINGEKIIGVISLICSISVILPIMFGNALPSAGIMIMAIGFLYRDGLVIILGIITSIVGLFVAGLVVVFGVKIVKIILIKLYSFLGSLLSSLPK
jgi:hypothetical protein